MTIRIALPKGRLLAETAAFLQAAGWDLEGYTPSLRNYRLRSRRFPELRAKTFHERDIPIQVAVGHYDLGICGLDWVEELSVRYTNRDIVKLRNLGFGKGIVCLAASPAGDTPTLDSLATAGGTVRIATEYPNLAEYLALRLRLRRFGIFALWGSAEAYPPENATAALLSRPGEDDVRREGLVPLMTLLRHSAFLVANRQSWEHRDLSPILDSLEGITPPAAPAAGTTPQPAGSVPAVWQVDEDTVRLALPDGHQQKHTAALLEKAGIHLEGYGDRAISRRPSSDIAGLVVKVVRPQDMPLQVANSNFDLAITGRDWLSDHLTVFPGSPVQQLLDLRSARVRMVAVVSQDVPADDIFSLRQLLSGREVPYRVASEYVNIADRYARENRLGRYRIIPTWGATEAFLPEDADMLIENTETGRTIKRHNLKIIDTLFESTGCVIGSRNGPHSPKKQALIDRLVRALRTAAGGE